MDYSLRAVSQGKDALGEVTVKVDFGEGQLVTGKTIENTPAKKTDFFDCSC
jgi:hypothetical protein